MIVTVNGRYSSLWDAEEPGEVLASRCYGRDWEWVLEHFGLELAPDTFEVAATLSIRHVGPVGAFEGRFGWHPPELGYPYPDLVIVYEFASKIGRDLVRRNYMIARRNGASRIVAKWVAHREAERLMRVGEDEQFAHLGCRFADTREGFEVESDNADEAVDLLNEATAGASWGWEDGELWLCAYEEE